ncbi:MAG TPA: hypothetical protein VGV09_07385 [Steroidobacteraceae bacterium]|nr:hypothetical protein [Steroidobacteraceae bacterium]
MIRRAASVAVLLALAACTHSISLVLPPQTVTVMAYADGKVVERCGFRPGSEKFQKLSQLLQQNSGGWHKRHSDYQPEILVVDGDVSLYFMSDSVVLNYSGGEFSRGIAPAAYHFLDCKVR